MACGNHQLINHVDCVELFHIDTEQPVACGTKLDFALFYLAARHIIVFADRAQALGRVVFMEHSLLHFPDVQMLLAHGKQHRDILFRDDMSLAELCALEFALHNARQIVAQHMADRVFRFDQLHKLPPDYGCLSLFFKKDHVYFNNFQAAYQRFHPALSENKSKKSDILDEKTHCS